MKTDEQLLFLIQKADMEAYSSLFTTYYKPLVLFAFSLVQHRESAEDIVQNFFCRLWENRKELDKINHCKSYFYTSIRNQCMNYIRDKKITLTDIPEQEDDSNILKTITEEEIYVELIRKIEQLPAQCRKVLLLKLEGLSNEEIAPLCGITEDTVRSQIRRGKDILRKQLQSHSPFLAVLFTIL